MGIFTKKIESDKPPFRIGDGVREIRERMNETPRFSPQVAAVMGGKIAVELHKKYLLRAMNEKWITAVEDCLQAMDAVIRKPSRFIEESEDILPIERSHNIQSRSLVHLSMHTDYLARVKGGVRPTKILNVFKDETLMTYENKFVNTLIFRVYEFIEERYRIILEQGCDESLTEFCVEDSFEDNGTNVKMTFRLECMEQNRETIAANHMYVTDTWHRLCRVRDIVGAYMKSDFCRALGKTFVRSPIVRTNAILKNKDLRACLALWEFIEGYQNAGYGVVVEERLERAGQRMLDQIYATLCMQYAIFKQHMQAASASEGVLAEERWEEQYVNAQMKSEFTAPKSDGQVRVVRAPSRSVLYRRKTRRDDQIALAIEMALRADKELARKKRKAAREADAISEELAASEPDTNGEA